MGGGDFGGNGSVVWNVHHGPKGTPTGPVPGTSPGADPGNNEVKVAGRASGKDGIATPAVFTVTLRYKSTTAAEAAWAAKKITPVGGEVLVSFEVPAIQNRPNRNADPPLEVQVDW